MKDIKQYICTLVQAKRLKELSTEQKSLFYWSRHREIDEFRLEYMEYCAAEYYSAFTSQELEELIHELAGKDESWEVARASDKQSKLNAEIDNPAFWMLRVHNIFGCKFIQQISCEENKAQALAEFLIDLLEHKK